MVVPLDITGKRTLYCSQCGAKTNSDARFCQGCGAKLSDDKSVDETPHINAGKPDLSPQQNESAIGSGKSEAQVDQPFEYPRWHDKRAEIDQSKNFLGGIHHPWRRFFARIVDLFLFGLLFPISILSFLFVLFPQHIDEAFGRALEYPITYGIVICLLGIPVEAAFLSITGTTPAKWILGISVVSTSGEKLKYSAALKRVFLVLIVGEGLGIPVVSFVTMVFAYRRLTKTTTTHWDTSVESVVTHKKWGVIRAIVNVLIVFAVIVITLMLG